MSVSEDRAIMSEWINRREWADPDSCPVHPDTLVDVKFGDGDIFLKQTKEDWDWSREHDFADTIVSYRLCQSNDTPRQVSAKSFLDAAAKHIGEPSERGNMCDKYDQGKAPLGLISSIAQTEEALVLAHGAKKYAAHDWRAGLEWSRLYDAVQRHLLAWNSGEDNDPETGRPHLAHARCGLGFLLEYGVTGAGLDDRYKAKQGESNG
jgi:hypothetical protein